jgi:hypothetical protein
MSKKLDAPKPNAAPEKSRSLASKHPLAEERRQIVQEYVNSLRAIIVRMLGKLH